MVLLAHYFLRHYSLLATFLELYTQHDISTEFIFLRLVVEFEIGSSKLAFAKHEERLIYLLEVSSSAPVERNFSGDEAAVSVPPHLLASRAREQAALLGSRGLSHARSSVLRMTGYRDGQID